MMKRDECLKVLLRHIPDEIVVAAYSTAFDWLVVRPNHALNYTSIGAMGLASSHALGLALARPDRKVIVLDGDGSLLMNLGSLVTIGSVAPRNLYHFVSDNGSYEANGGHPTPAQKSANFAGIAAQAGYRTTHEFSDLADFERSIGDILHQPGPAFIDLKVVQGVPAPMDYGVLYAASSRTAFKAALAQS